MTQSLRYNLIVSAVLMTRLLGQSSSIQDLSQKVERLPVATIFKAREVVTLDPANPRGTALAVVDGRILAAGGFEELKGALGDQPYTVDESFADSVVVPGFIAQHDHPFLTALTMTCDIIAIEDWVLPSGTVRAAKNEAEYMTRLRAVEASMADPAATLLTWGFHHSFHGELTREKLDAVSATRPIIVWHRSAHEFIVNSAALRTYGVDEAFVAKMSPSARAQTDLKKGHFFEQGLFGVIERFAPAIATPDRLTRGLEFMIAYFHANGITLGCEPGGLLSKRLQEAQNAVLSNRATPFRFYFMGDGKSLVAKYGDQAIAETEILLTWGEGMTAFLPKQVKLFADGAIYSQLMQMKDGYTDGHKGEWIMDPDFLKRAFRLYWEAGYQIHVHVNGDAGLDVLLDTLEENMRRKPRHDHRTVVVHFACSTTAQVGRAKRLGAIVSGNPYYVTALSDQYAKSGLGPERADSMVRLGDVERAGMSFSFHSDMPMAPAQPLFLMHCAVNRTTASGRVAGPEQRVSREAALRAVTIDAAYSLQLEDSVGSIVPGKLANLTILSDNPVTCDPVRIKDIAVWGTVHEGRVLPVARAASRTSAGHGRTTGRLHLDRARLGRPEANPEASHGAECSCAIGKVLGELMFQ